MIGKNGISKLVLSSVIPIINYELARLLDEVCDFDIELEMNNKNEVDFNIIKKNVTKKLKSGSGLETTLASLALRCVLGRISTLPKPNIIVFDEVLGKVANINLDYVNYLLAICYYEQIVDEKKDLQSILKAKESFLFIQANYPNSEFALDAEFKIDLINDILAAKEIYIAAKVLPNISLPALSVPNK